MNYIYTSTRDNSRYILDPQVTMGNKVCLVNLSTCEDKFVSPQDPQAGVQPDPHRGRLRPGQGFHRHEHRPVPGQGCF